MSTPRIRNIVGGFALGMMTGSAITAGTILLATPAKAAPSEAAVERAVCLMIDSNPTIPGVVHAAAEISNYGVTAYQSGQIIALSVTEQCPEYIPLLQRFVKEYGGDGNNTFQSKMGGKVA